jgi:wyosine [tRNA(Phe)-imidazoG37] synthetase (radical SAM superfamily)
MSFLFDDIIFGPVRSRRLGVSLGINVLPESNKICTFNCIYCECGWTRTPSVDPACYHLRRNIRTALDARLKELAAANQPPDAITFAGNGEPTLHPEFAGVIEDVNELRDKYFPKAGVVVLSNSTTLGDPDVFRALTKVRNIMKLDAGSEETFRSINGPLVPVRLEKIVNDLVRFNGKLIIQTLFLRTFLNGQWVDNTTDEEVSLWIGHLKRIRPQQVMIYPIDRPAPSCNIEKTGKNVLLGIAGKATDEGFHVSVYG